MLISALIFMMALFPPSPADSDTLIVLSDSMYVAGGSIVNLGVTSSWRFSPGDDIRWAEPRFDHSDWVKQRPSGITEPLPSPLWDEGYGWFRTYFMADSSIYNNPWSFTTIHGISISTPGGLPKYISMENWSNRMANSLLIRKMKSDTTQGMSYTLLFRSLQKIHILLP